MCFDHRLAVSSWDPLVVAFSQNRLGSDAVHSDPEGANLGGEIFRQDFDTGLRGGIGDWGFGVRTVAGDGGYRNDVPGLPTLHTRQNALDRQERCCEISVDRSAPPLF